MTGFAIVKEWVMDELRRCGQCDIKVDHTEAGGVNIGGRKASGYVATVEANGRHGAFTVVLRAVNSDDVAQEFLWIVGFSAARIAQSVLCAKMAPAAFNDRFMSPEHKNSPFSTLWLSRVTNPKHPERKVLGLDIEFAAKSYLLPSDDAQSRAIGQEVAEMILEDLDVKALPAVDSDPWSRHILESPRMSAKRRG